MGLKYKVNENFFEKWTPLMSYILGYLYADGSLEDASYLRGKYLRVTSTDKQLIQLTRQALGSEHTVVVIPPKLLTQKTRYFLRIGSTKIFNDLLALGLFPNKSLTMKFPDVESLFLSHFVRGYFDGDGHVGVQKNKNAFKKMVIVFVSGSKDFLDQLMLQLNNKLNLKVLKVYKGPKAYRLAYSTADSVKIFKYMYNEADKVYLRRKFGVFKSFFTEYSKWADFEVKQVLSRQAR